MSNTSIRLIVGLGNIGDAYKGTRHNAGFHFVDEVANEYGARFQADRKFFGDVAKARIGGVEVILLKPSTLMNLTGKAVAAVRRHQPEMGQGGGGDAASGGPGH